MEIYIYIYIHVKSESKRVVTYLFYLDGAYTDDGTWMGGWMNGRVDRLVNISHTFLSLTSFMWHPDHPLGSIKSFRIKVRRVFCLL